MAELKEIWLLLSPESDFWLLVLLWAIAFYLGLGSWHGRWSEQLMTLFRVVPQVDEADSFTWIQGVLLGVSLLPFLLLGLAGHLFFLWGFGHIWSVSLAVLGCICGGISELIRQNETLS